MRKGSLSAASLLCLILVGCGGSPAVKQGPAPAYEKDSAPDKLPTASQMQDAVPRYEAPSRYGNPASYEVFGKRYYTLNSSDGYVERGIASWYGNKFHGRRTSSGEPYDMYKMTAAHKTLPLPSYVQVINLDNGRKVIVRVNDRGPFHDDRLIDLSYSAATKLGITARGTGRVEVRAIQSGQQAALSRSALTTQTNAPMPADTVAKVQTFIQVGAFSSIQKAEQIKQTIQQQIDEPVQITPFNQGGNALYRVRVGPLAGQQAGTQIADRLANLGFAETRMIFE
ncbi:Rare lipoprotein A precursor [Methylophaga frappieri]|uniref:Endolytic peptidoglycan transglycosylase RlpA n=1 Tax=Methylophaga frappieri (strain ATCC BAA-2434 / DSM 25690 / JAM7) TaxID=754477 RepID=I1YHD4_METFJ|nr:septal ring lytic transglycosylase RlpA family protein [Methylophaga frappieri]AFJ02327.1 Rare lipoprotein A precursor [Methylophaga frappieri]